MRSVDFVFAFICVFSGLVLVSSRLGPSYARLCAASVSLFLPRASLSGGVGLELAAGSADFVGSPWQVSLLVTRGGVLLEAIPIDARSLCFLPLLAFTALVVATPQIRPRRKLGLVLLGVPLLQLVLLALTAAPVLSFLGGTGPVTARALPLGVHVALQVLYRGLVAPPGMAYALPLLAWWGSCARGVGALSVPNATGSR